MLIKQGIALTFKQEHDTRIQMEVISKGDRQSTDVHAVRSKQRQRSDPCPAKLVQGKYCGKNGHFLKVCTKRIIKNKIKK